MKVCPNCFADKELKGFIISSIETGDCKFCESKSQKLLDISELYDFFQELVGNFQLVDTGEQISSKIQGHWSFFSSHNTANKILNFVLPKLSTNITSSSQPVDYVDDIIDNYSHWEVLKEELKWKNRFVINIERLVEDLGWDGFFNTPYELSPKVELYRARLHHKSGLPVYKSSEMNCPPKEFASGGRANPLGIPFLYLCDNLETVLYEVRASYLDELSLVLS